jgi:Apea-like HEPN
MYELRAADRDAFTKVYDALGTIDGKLQIPLRRFNQGYDRQSGEDTIIDLTIALESCLLPKTRDELQYRLSMRGAALLSCLRNPLKTQALLKTMYEIRSEIVHNGKLLSEVRRKIESLGSVVPKDFLHACEDVVRDVLRELILRLATNRLADPGFLSLKRGDSQRPLNKAPSQPPDFLVICGPMWANGNRLR